MGSFKILLISWDIEYNAFGKIYIIKRIQIIGNKQDN